MLKKIKLKYPLF